MTTTRTARLIDAALASLPAYVADAYGENPMTRHFTGHIIARIRNAINALAKTADGDGITIDNLQQNNLDGIHQARVRLAGDPTVYRLILAPAEAPLSSVRGSRPIGDLFPLPLGDG